MTLRAATRVHELMGPRATRCTHGSVLSGTEPADSTVTHDSIWCLRTDWWCPQGDTPGSGSGAGVCDQRAGLCRDGSSSVTTCRCSGIRSHLEGRDQGVGATELRSGVTSLMLCASAAADGYLIRLPRALPTRVAFVYKYGSESLRVLLHSSQGWRTVVLPRSRGESVARVRIPAMGRSPC